MQALFITKISPLNITFSILLSILSSFFRNKWGVWNTNDLGFFFFFFVKHISEVVTGYWF